MNTNNLLSASASAAVAAAAAAAAGQQVLQPQQPPAMPQLILASGQLVQGIQGAQLLIPTSQGKYTFDYAYIYIYMGQSNIP